MGGAGVAGFQAGGPLIEADQTVGVGQAELPIADGVHPDGGVLPNARVVQDQLPGHEGNVMGGGHVPLVSAMPSSWARWFIWVTKAPSLPARCSASATAQSLPDTTVTHLIISDTGIRSPSSR